MRKSRNSERAFSYSNMLAIIYRYLLFLIGIPKIFSWWQDGSQSSWYQYWGVYSRNFIFFCFGMWEVRLIALLALQAAVVCVGKVPLPTARQLEFMELETIQVVLNLSLGHIILIYLRQSSCISASRHFGNHPMISCEGQIQLLGGTVKWKSLVPPTTPRPVAVSGHV